jgi:hypothetical protein
VGMNLALIVLNLYNSAYTLKNLLSFISGLTHPHYFVFLSFYIQESDDIMLRIPPNISSNRHPFFDMPSGEYLSGIPIPYLTSVHLWHADL